MSDRRTSRHESRVPTPAPRLLHLGISLGSHRIAVAASNGTREHFGSLVGWPRSSAARQLLARDALFGNDAFRNRVALDVVRPLERGELAEAARMGSDDLRAVYRRALTELVRQAVRLARPVPGERTHGVVSAPPMVLKEGKELVLEAARETLDEVELVSEPWAVACAAEAEPGAVLVDLGGGSTTVCRIGQSPPADAELRVIPGGGDAIDVELARLLREHHKGAEFSVAAARELKERHGCHLEGGPVSAGLSIEGRTRTVDVSLELAEACRSVVGPVIDAVKAVAAPGPLSVVLTGGGSQMKGIDRLIEEALRSSGGKVSKAAEPIFAGAMGALVIAVRASQS